MKEDIYYDPEYIDHHYTYWDCNVCKAINSSVDGECQFCECEGLMCKRDNCSGEHGCLK